MGRINCSSHVDLVKCHLHCNYRHSLTCSQKHFSTPCKRKNFKHHSARSSSNISDVMERSNPLSHLISKSRDVVGKRTSSLFSKLDIKNIYLKKDEIKKTRYLAEKSNKILESDLKTLGTVSITTFEEILFGNSLRKPSLSS